MIESQNEFTGWGVLCWVGDRVELACIGPREVVWKTKAKAIVYATRLSVDRYKVIALAVTVRGWTTMAEAKQDVAER